MEALAFGYVGIATKSVADWVDLTKSVLGFQIVEQTQKQLSLRMDDKKQRMFVDQGLPEGANIFGWEVADAAALNGLAARLESAGVRVTRGSSGLADQRQVRELIAFNDPSGNHLEAFYGQNVSSDPFVPSRAISGFRTGPLGLGHIALTVKSLDETYPFYRDLLGFKLSDYVLTPFRANFMHINRRHHSLALIETGTNGVHHLMVELYSWDDIGQGYDIALTQKERVSVTLGRHTNDFMTSFYVNSPSNMLLEYGWGGRDIDLGNETPFELIHGPSLWGHERSWLSPEGRAEALRLRLNAGAQGVRAPVQVLDGNFKKSEGFCPWWDKVKS